MKIFAPQTLELDEFKALDSWEWVKGQMQSVVIGKVESFYCRCCNRLVCSVAVKALEFAVEEHPVDLLDNETTIIRERQIRRERLARVVGWIRLEHLRRHAQDGP